MKARAWGRRVQRGVVAVELALLLPIALLLLPYLLFYGRVFWHYTAAQKIAHDTARYLSSVPVIEMKTSARATHAVAVAQAMAQAALAELRPGTGAFSPAVGISCSPLCSGAFVPATVRVEVDIIIYDDVFGGITSGIIGVDGLPLSAVVTMPYVGN
ncbi:MAG TPA: hypothetical protein DCW29_16005 [Janthinobacterium sp.]|nr:hypothetical protein [Janthinobacterium sp.]